MLSAYENFVSKIDIDEGDERLGCLGKLDAGTLKLKVEASIIAISSLAMVIAALIMRCGALIFNCMIEASELRQAHCL